VKRQALFSIHSALSIVGRRCDTKDVAGRVRGGARRRRRPPASSPYITHFTRRAAVSLRHSNQKALGTLSDMPWQTIFSLYLAGKRLERKICSACMQNSVGVLLWDLRRIKRSKQKRRMDTQQREKKDESERTTAGRRRAWRCHRAAAKHNFSAATFAAPLARASCRAAQRGAQANRAAAGGGRGSSQKMTLSTCFLSAAGRDGQRRRMTSHVCWARGWRAWRGNSTPLRLLCARAPAPHLASCDSSSALLQRIAPTMPASCSRAAQTLRTLRLGWRRRGSPPPVAPLLSGHQL